MSNKLLTVILQGPLGQWAGSQDWCHQGEGTPQVPDPFFHIDPMSPSANDDLPRAHNKFY